MTTSPDTPEIDLTTDVVTLTRQLMDINSVSLNELELADAVERALAAYDHLVVERRGNSIVARTDLGLPERVVIAGHLDTVPVNGNFPSRLDEATLKMLAIYVHSLGGGK